MAQPINGGLCSRRSLLATLGLLPIAGCSLSPALSRVGEQAAFTLRGAPDAPVDRAYVEKLPYASMLARIGKGPRSLVVLYEQQKDVLFWIAADRTVLVTKQGRLVKTGGIEKGITDTQFTDPDPLPGLLRSRGAQVTRTADFQYRSQFSVPITATLRPKGEETIEILGKTHRTWVFEEKGQAPMIDWTFTNTFWLDADTGFVWKTRQEVTPDLPVVETAITKPAST